MSTELEVIDVVFICIITVFCIAIIVSLLYFIYTIGYQDAINDNALAYLKANIYK